MRRQRERRQDPASRIQSRSSRASMGLDANIHLHYVLDFWVHHWRKQHATGSDVIIVRYAATLHPVRHFRFPIRF